MPDVIVMDILLDYNSSFVLLHELQACTKDSCVPIILCSNIAEGFSLKTLERYGVKAVLDKLSMQPDDLISAIRKVEYGN